MPMMKNGKPNKDELPSTLQRSDAKAQRTFAEAHDSAAEEYGDGERAHRTAYSALKHSYEKVGDHWEPKDHKGPSDAQAKGGRDTDRKTAGGVDANASKEHLYEVAQKLDISGRSTMTKDELVKAIQKANDNESAKSRG
ncbi:MAG TPA: ChaB family protein [Segeticoccus sp.]|nr:ChaB family protein [Segeticoccus sp.]HET8601731.1 ChaB family protein [Segeticoccus sp.]